MGKSGVKSEIMANQSCYVKWLCKRWNGFRFMTLMYIYIYICMYSMFNINSRTKLIALHPSLMSRNVNLQISLMLARRLEYQSLVVMLPQCVQRRLKTDCSLYGGKGNLLTSGAQTCEKYLLKLYMLRACMNDM